MIINIIIKGEFIYGSKKNNWIFKSKDYSYSNLYCYTDNEWSESVGR